jgi:hypothetical protein
MKLIVLVMYMLLIILILLIPQIPDAAETESIRSNEVTVRFEKPLKTVAMGVMRTYPTIKHELEKKLRLEIDFVPTIILIRDGDSFQKIAGNRLVVAVAISKDNLIVIDNSKMKTRPFSLSVTVKHELCHLALHDYVGKGNLPRWLNEGIAQWVSDGIADILIGEDRDILKKATLSGRYIPMSSLASKFPAETHLLRLSYEESKSFVAYIIKEYGIEGVLSILDNLQKGDRADAAFRKGLSVSLYEFEEQWHASLKRRTTWFTYFSSHIYEIIFTFAALFLTYGFIQFLIRKRSYKDEDDDEDGDYPE